MERKNERIEPPQSLGAKTHPSLLHELGITLRRIKRELEKPAAETKQKQKLQKEETSND